MDKNAFISMISALDAHFKNESKQEEIEFFIEKAANANPWFSLGVLRFSLSAIQEAYLDVKAWEQFFEEETWSKPKHARKVGLILAGNLPAVGLHDVLMVLASGHAPQVKLSSQDQIFMGYFLDLMSSYAPDVDFVRVEQMNAVDAVIATGSDFAGRYFEQYFKQMPHIIRKNRSSVAVLKGNEGPEEWKALAQDVFAYYGLGCRNVSSIFLPEGMDLIPLFDVLSAETWVMQHPKYANNYAYQRAKLLLNQEVHYDLGNALVKVSEELISPLSVLHLHYYQGEDQLAQTLAQYESQIQCCVGHQGLPLGEAQRPGLKDWADGINTYAFLKNLN